MANVGEIRKGYMFFNKNGELQVVEHPTMVEEGATCSTIHTRYYGGYARNKSGKIITDTMHLIRK